MSTRRECRLSESAHRNVDLRIFEAEIIETIEATVPNKNPVVYKDHFTTDELTRGEAIQIGRALAKRKDLSVYGKTVSIFRLFDGKTVDVEEPAKKPRGGRKR